MHENLGAYNYETDLYKFKLNEWGSYDLIFKKQLDSNNQIYLFSNGQFKLINYLKP